MRTTDHGPLARPVRAGFNPGSTNYITLGAGGMSKVSAAVAVNTTIAAAAGTIATLFIAMAFQYFTLGEPPPPLVCWVLSSRHGCGKSVACLSTAGSDHGPAGRCCRAMHEKPWPRALGAARLVRTLHPSRPQYTVHQLKTAGMYSPRSAIPALLPCPVAAQAWLCGTSSLPATAPWLAWLQSLVSGQQQRQHCWHHHHLRTSLLSTNLPSVPFAIGACPHARCLWVSV